MSRRRRVTIVPERRVLFVAVIVDDETGERIHTTEEWEREADAIADARCAVDDSELLVSINDCREVG